MASFFAERPFNSLLNPVPKMCPQRRTSAGNVA